MYRNGSYAGWVSRRLLILWVLFLARGTFYCAMLPLWEGWDEYAHFAVLDHWVYQGTMPRLEDAVPREIDESMRLTPLAEELKWIGPPYQTHEQWWALPERERDERVRQLAALLPAWAHERASHYFVSYEAQQPPLYYWLLAVPLKLAAQWPLRARVLLMRLLSMLIASTAIPLTWQAARVLLDNRAATYCAALLAVAPGFAIDTARVANDCVAIACTALFFWLLVRPKTNGIAMGATLGAALLAKAYLLALVPALVILWFPKKKRTLAAALAAALALAGWWYARNLLIGYSLSGWSDRAGLGHALRGIVHINWLSAIDVTAKSFIWFGAWSFLTLKSWMYRVIEMVAGVGLFEAVRRRRANLRIPFAAAGCYLLGMGYAVLVLFAVHGTQNAQGWYMWPIAGMLAVIVVAGLRSASVVLVSLLAVLDLYGAMARLAPYYAGFVARDHGSAAQFPAALMQLGVPMPLAAMWIAATVAIPLVCAARR